MNNILRMAVVVSMLCASGCFRHTFDVGAGAPYGRVVYNQWHGHHLYGLVGNTVVKVKEFCPSGNATILERTTFINGLIGSVIGLIYAPTTVTIRCDDGRVSTLPLTRDEVANVVENQDFSDFVAELAPENMANLMLARRRLAAEAQQGVPADAQLAALVLR